MLTNTDPKSLTDIQRAGRFFYLQKNSFGGLVVAQHFHYGVAHPPNFNPRRIPEIIKKVQERLQNVQIEWPPYEQVLRRYDRPTTLCYLDPPYWGPQLYRHNFQEADFRLLADRSREVKGKFILSLDDRVEVREVFADFKIDRFEMIYTRSIQTRQALRRTAHYEFQTVKRKDRAYD